jgi:hypothetical protein
MTTSTRGRFRRAQVASSPAYIRKPPSPTTLTTGLSGCSSLAAIAKARPTPIGERPLET